jgi:hypothetical protein
MSWPRTLADSPDVLTEHLVTPGGEMHPTRRVVAPCCRARVFADQVADLRAVPGTLVRAGGRRPMADVEWACDGCRTRMIRSPDNDWTHSRIARATGAPAEDIRTLRAIEMVEEESRRTPEHFDASAAMERALAALPVGARDLPGTEPPGRSGRVG